MRRFLFLLLPFLALLGLFSWVALESTAQDPPKKMDKEEEEEPGKGKLRPRPKVDDEVEDAKPKTKVGRPTDKTPARPAATNLEAAASDLLQAARESKNKIVRDYFNSIGEPHELIVTKRGTVKRAAPLEEYLGSPPSYHGRMRYRLFLDNEWTLDSPWDAIASSVTGIKYYEQVVLSRTDDFLEPVTKNKTPPLPKIEMLQLAETALTFAVRFHDSAHERGKRNGEAFEALGMELRKKLRDVQVMQLSTYAETKDWNEALALSRKLAAEATHREERERIARPMAEILQGAVKSGNYTREQLRDLQEQLLQLEQQFPDSAAVKPLRDSLKAQAQAIFDKAMRVPKENSTEAIDLLRQAETIWPRLPGVQDEILRRQNAYPILRVGVRDFPVNLSPGLASTDSEKWAVELQFESLVKLITTPGSGQRYEAGLATGLPKLVPLGRQFTLPADAFWSNERHVTGQDVKYTVRLLKDARWSGHNPAWAHLIDDVQVSGDGSRVNIAFHQGYVDPLSLLTFKVLPQYPWDQDQQLMVKQDLRFAAEPVGSGPYVYKGRKATKSGREYACFVANQNYGVRSSRQGRPVIREIHFFASEHPDEDLKNRVVDIVPDLPTDRVKPVLEGAPNTKVLPPVTPLRVYFFAVNHRRPVLKNENLRRAVAHAINREKALDDYFRKGFGAPVHKPLTGPFPAGSWATNGDLKYAPALAKTLMNLAAKEGVKDVKLSLKYPTDDQRIRQAMEYLRTAVQNEIGVELELQGVTPAELKQDVEGTHSYDLAYFHYDFPSDALFLWPLFDPASVENKGTNFLGYVGDATVEQQFRIMMGHRDFEKVKETAKILHAELFKKMPLIPLWQLDRHVALTNDVQVVNLDPLLIFNDVDRWRMEKK